MTMFEATIRVFAKAAGYVYMYAVLGLVFGLFFLVLHWLLQGGGIPLIWAALVEQGTAFYDWAAKLPVFAQILLAIGIVIAVRKGAPVVFVLCVAAGLWLLFLIGLLGAPARKLIEYGTERTDEPSTSKSTEHASSAGDQASPTSSSRVKEYISRRNTMALLMAELAADSRQESRPRADQGEKQVSLRIPDTEAGRDWLARYASEYEPAESLVVGPRLVIRAFEGFQKGEILQLRGIGRTTCYLNSIAVAPAAVAANTRAVDESGIKALPSC